MTRNLFKTGRLGGFSWLVAAAFLGAAAPRTQAALIENVANEVATVQPAGPRPGPNGKTFLNIEGSINGAFASFGVADFQFGPLGTVYGVGPTLTLSLTQSNAGFTHNGSLQFFLTTDTTTSIQPGTSPLQYLPTFPPTGIGVQLATLLPLGSGTFTEVSSGTVDHFILTLTAAEQTYLINQLNGNGRVRLLIGAGDATVAATLAGLGNFDGPAPTLSFDAAVVPEPSSLVLAGIGIAGVFGIARRRRGVVAG